ncbi:hypothetical protein PHSY_004868 [Pseudozyma hubeiensis SY62]|uniref:Uncharacterized protein n=1 Tax=Pseudozyma hubeiensis (strain SY62) TaxID=1305764 RepID=R9P7B8_PSEHS|nr:hypothetical protein PHSY_004868 [Pseudozyma hubeiensis SY62]GAC97283.1 hypothetical protein PHSY_004868 [Pseudozyma hubeiensis SY62]
MNNPPRDVADRLLRRLRELQVPSCSFDDVDELLHRVVFGRGDDAAKSLCGRFGDSFRAGNLTSPKTEGEADDEFLGGFVLDDGFEGGLMADTNMDDIDASFDDAYRTSRIEAGDDPSTLPNPYSRPSLTAGASRGQAGRSSSANGTAGGFIAETNDTGGGGGFVVDDDDDGGGGFIVDDEDDDEVAHGAGFMPEDQDRDEASTSSPSITRPATIPLSAIPEALSNLGLDSSDPSVLSLFAETAYTPSSASRRRLAPGAKPEKVVGRQEFQQVALVLLDELQSRNAKRSQEDEEEEESGGRRRPSRRAAVRGRRKAAEIAQEDADGGGGFIVDDGDDSEEDFEVSSRRRGNKALDTGSDLTSEDEASIHDSRRRRRRNPATPPSPIDSDSEHTPKRQRRSRNAPTIRSTTHLNPLQRDTASTLFQLLLDRLTPSSSSSSSSTLPLAQRRIGTTELTTILSSLGDKLPPKEIEEMIEEGAKLFAPATEDGGEAKSNAAIKGAAAAQGITGASVGLDEFAGILVHNRLL